MSADPLAQMLAHAHASTMTRDDVVAQLAKALLRNAAYLARRERRGHRTAYNEVLEADMEAMARAIVLLQEE